MAKDQLIDDHVSLDQSRRAIEALHSHESKKQQKIQETELISGKEPNIWLNVTVKTIPPGHRIKPVKIPIAHPLVDPRTTPICLITKDPQRQYKDLLETHNIKFISRVVGIEKLKGKFKPFEARRALLKENGMFLADERVIPLLPKLLGKKWFEAKKQPIPVCLTRKDLKGELERTISSTYMNQNQGTCTSIKIATLSHKPSQILANLEKAVPTIVANIKGGWENIQSLHIKTNSSVSLPIWSCTLDASEEGRWHNLENDGFAGVSESEGEKTPAKTGKKRPSSSDEESESEEGPRKRAKNSKSSSSSKSSSLPAPTPVLPSPKPQKRKPATSPAPKAEHKSKAAKAENVSKKPIKSQPVAAPVEEPTELKGSTVGKGSSSDAKPKAAKKSKTPVVESSPSKKGTTEATSKAKSTAPPPTPAPKKTSETTKKAKTSETISSAKDAPATKPSAKLSKKDDLKSKRNTASIDKKKEKIVKQKGGKSAKNAVLGKKVAQE